MGLVDYIVNHPCLVFYFIIIPITSIGAYSSYKNYKLQSKWFKKVYKEEG